MIEKDYYSVFRLLRQSPQSEIKRSFRQLAMRYHPDKNGDDLLAAAQFREINEAYRILSNPAKRAAYDQRRWYAGNRKSKETENNNSPDRLLLQAQKLSLYIRRVPPTSVDREALSAYIEQLMSSDGWNLLKHSADNGKKKELIIYLVQSSLPLTFTQTSKLAVPLLVLAAGDPESIELIERSLRQKRFDAHWNRYRVPMILFITIVICFLIYYTSN